MSKTRSELLDLFARQVADWLRRYPAEVGIIRERVCAALKFTHAEFRAWVESWREKDAVEALQKALDDEARRTAEAGSAPRGEAGAPAGAQAAAALSGFVQESGAARSESAGDEGEGVSGCASESAPASVAADAVTDADIPPEFLNTAVGGLEFDAGGDGEKADWLDKEFPALLIKVSNQVGSKRAIAVAYLVRQIALHLAGRDAATEALVREQLCESIKEIKKADYEKCLREAKAKLKSAKDERSNTAAAEGDSGDWVGLGRKFLRTLGADRAILYWREIWYEWVRARGAYIKRDDKKWITKQITLWLSELGMMHDERSVANLRNALTAICYIDSEIVPPYWLTKTELAEQRNKSVFISLENGILDLESVRFIADPSELEGYKIQHADLIEHTAEFFTVNSLPYKFDPTARCPQLDDAIQKWQPAGPDDPEGLGALILQEFAGYIFEPGQPHQVMLLNWGPGSDGKSQYKDLLIALAGKDNVSTLGLEALDPSQTHVREPLIGATLWTVPDANQIEKLGEGTLKAITGGDSITIPRKWVSAWRGVVEAKVVMNCNEFPGFRDRSEGIWRRIILLHWRPVTGTIIRDFAKQLIANEMPGIFIWALRGWRRLRESGFSRRGIILENVQRVRRETQQELSFFDQHVEIVEETKDHRVSNEQLMEAYVNWCKANNVKPYAHPETLGRALSKWVRWQLERAEPPWAADQIAEFLKENAFHPLRTEPGKPRRRFYVRVRLLLDEPKLSETVPLGKTHNAPPHPTFFKA